MATNIPMNTLEHVTYFGDELNALSVSGCEWRKPYWIAFPEKQTGVKSIVVTRNSTQSNCDQITTNTLNTSGNVLYGDNITISATADIGYNTPNVSSVYTNSMVVFPAIQRQNATGTKTEDGWYTVNVSETIEYPQYSGLGACKINDVPVSTDLTEIGSEPVTLHGATSATKTWYAQYTKNILTVKTILYAEGDNATFIVPQIAEKSFGMVFTLFNVKSSSLTLNVASRISFDVTAGSLKNVTITIVNPTYGTVKNGSTTLSNGALVPYGIELTLVPTAATGYTTTVSTSLGGGTTSETTTVTANENLTITFARVGNTYWVYYEKGTASSGVLPSAQSRIYPNAVTLATNNMTKNSDTVATYTVTYNYNGGSGDVSSETAKRTRYYTANGWTTTSGGTSRIYANGASFGTDEATNLTLYPYFSYTTSTSSVTLPSAKKDGYDLLGWSTSYSTENMKAGTSYTPASDITLYATWLEVGSQGINITFPSINGISDSFTDVTINGVNYYAYSLKSSENTYTGYDNSICTINGVTVGTTITYITEEGIAPSQITSRCAKFVNGTLTIWTSTTVYKTSTGPTHLSAPESSTTAIFTKLLTKPDITSANLNDPQELYLEISNFNSVPVTCNITVYDDYDDAYGAKEVTINANTYDQPIYVELSSSITSGHVEAYFSASGYASSEISGMLFGS